ncbi:Protein EMRE -like protein, mitochondrial [Echinococcus granulosus]|uniref:Essential MCU regulator, mitochondrial n=2 Tax=Echinococcus TaxID=6209 RepID=A0A068WE54_ECHGR|nr:Protein EMRE -like protein, mitochondrial [Echinococcus granulosus]CDS15931.1 expressed conserved protein [Echinococcus granulosus]CDS40742.1 expressed conserved protein [Echinococcus multilocularis]
MCGKGFSLFRIFSRSRIDYNHYYLCGEGVYRSTGAISDAPHQTNFGLLKVVCIVAPFLFTGAYISKAGAKFLEDNEIFVPEDD